MLPARVKEGNYDILLFLLIVVLLCCGVVMIYSASHFTGSKRFDSPTFFLKKQLIALVVGAIAMAILSRIPYWRLRSFAWPLLVVAILMLVAVLFTPPINGARRWIRLPFTTFMPAEVAKFSLILFYAHFLSLKRSAEDPFTRVFLPCMGVLILVGGLVYKQPDFSTSVIIASLSFFLMYVGCVSILHIGSTLASGAVVVVYMALRAPYRWARVKNWLDPFADRFGGGYHIIQSLIAVGSGGVTGVGLGQSVEKYGYLPYQYNDYIFAVIAEEVGLLGCAILLGLFFALLWRGFTLSMGAPDRFGMLLGAGITFHITLQALTNVAVVTNLLPATGLPLPFISYSGSSLVVTMASMGVLLNISRYYRPVVSEG